MYEYNINEFAKRFCLIFYQTKFLQAVIIMIIEFNKFIGYNNTKHEFYYILTQMYLLPANQLKKDYFLQWMCSRIIILVGFHRQQCVIFYMYYLTYSFKSNLKPKKYLIKYLIICMVTNITNVVVYLRFNN